MDKLKISNLKNLIQECVKEVVNENKNWIQKSIKHPGKCTPITKPGCNGHAKALAMRFKKGDIHKDNIARESQGGTTVPKDYEDINNQMRKMQEEEHSEKREVQIGKEILNNIDKIGNGNIGEIKRTIYDLALELIQMHNGQ